MLNNKYDSDNKSTYNKPIPTQTKSTQKQNYYNILCDHELNDYDDTDDDKTVVTSNRSKHECDNATAATADLSEDDLSSDEEECVAKPSDFAILDSGATAHFMVKGAPVINKQVALNPLHIKLPNGAIIQSTHTCNLNIPWLPDNITEAHIVPGLSHSSLVATRQFCDAGCKIVFDTNECKISIKDNWYSRESETKHLDFGKSQSLQRKHQSIAHSTATHHQIRLSIKQ